MRLVRRKWGHYFVILDRKCFKVKLLRFRRYGELSIQWHKYRSELWLFLKGQGRLEIDGTVVMNEDANYNGRYYMIERGDIHTFEAWKPTWILEVQFGNKCTEEDIVRL